MAVVNSTVCDVYGTNKDVLKIHISVMSLDESGNPLDGIVDETRDLCPNALSRVVKGVKRSLTRGKGGPHKA